MDEKSLYEAVRRIADIVHATISAHHPNLSMDDWRGEEPNPYYDQTYQGLFLEFYYGMPNSLWTPWGKWSFGGSGSGHFDKVAGEILEKFGATLYKPLKTTKMGEFGPIYALHKVDGTAHPEPSAREHSDYISWEEAKAIWARLQ